VVRCLDPPAAAPRRLPSRDDLEAKIIAFTIRHNKNARPYKWSYDADADHARYLECHLQPEAVPALTEAA